MGSGDLKDGPEARRGAATPEASSLTSPDPKARINHGFQGGLYPRWGCLPRQRIGAERRVSETGLRRFTAQANVNAGRLP